MRIAFSITVEPFSASGTYFDYGELSAARSRNLRLYGTDGTTITESTGPAPREITVTDGEDSFSFEREDFEALILELPRERIAGARGQGPRVPSSSPRAKRSAQRNPGGTSGGVN